MFRQIVPRVCRQVKNCRIPVRGYRRDLPVRWSRSLSPWDNFFSDMRPFFSRNMEDHFRDMSRRMDQMRERCSPFYTRYAPRPGETFTRTEAAEVKLDNKTFEVKVDVKQYEPEHLKVTEVEDRLVVTGKHETKADEHGYVSREFTREFHIPENVDRESMTSRLTDDRFLVIEAKIKGSEEQAKRVIEIKKEGAKQTEE